MQTATVSSKFQICIPKQIREEMHYEAGQQLIFITKGSTLYLVPKRSMKELKGVLKGANTDNIRDREDRV